MTRLCSSLIDILKDFIIMLEHWYHIYIKLYDAVYLHICEEIFRRYSNCYIELLSICVLREIICRYSDIY